MSAASPRRVYVMADKPKSRKDGNPEAKRWTVAIYMAADGKSGSRDLDQVATRELAQIVQSAAVKSGAGQKPLATDLHVAMQLDMHDVEGLVRLHVQDDGKVS